MRKALAGGNANSMRRKDSKPMLNGKMVTKRERERDQKERHIQSTIKGKELSIKGQVEIGMASSPGWNSWLNGIPTHIPGPILFER